VTATAYATTGTNFEDVEIPGTGLTMRAVCGPSNTSAVYLTDDDGSAAYDVAGTYNLTTTGSTHATVLYTGHLSDPNLAQGLGLVHLTQAADMGVASEFILSWGSGSGGTMRLDVSVARGSHHALVHAGMYLSASECLVQVDATPAT
jgi:hypothetical protein